MDVRPILQRPISENPSILGALLPRFYICQSFAISAAIFLLSGNLPAQSTNSAVPENSDTTAQFSDACATDWTACPATDAYESDSDAQQTSTSTSPNTASASNSSFVNGPNDWVHKWTRMVDAARASQPHYVAPLITTHVDLVEQFRWDSTGQTNPNGSGTVNHGSGRGLEIIPTTHIEIQVAPPPYIVHSGPMPPDGFGDLSMFFKYRLASATEGKGDYFIGAFLGLSIPTGSPPNGLDHTTLSPMFAFAKGWPGYLSIQNTFSGVLPTSGTNLLGRQFVWNTTVQAYGIKKYIWPEVEQNTQFFYDGPFSGDKQTFITPGVIIGYFRIAERLRFGVGGGMQIAVTEFHLYDHRWIWSVRLPF